MASPDALASALAAAIADGASVDWPEIEHASTEAGGADLVRQFRVIFAIGAGRRAEAAVSPPWYAALLAASHRTIVVLAGAKLILAAVGMPAALSRGLPVAGPFTLNVLIFGLAGAALIAGGARDRRLQLLGGLFLTIASAFVDPLIPRWSGGALGTLVAALRTLQPEAFLALALWLFVWAFPSEPRTRGARRLAETFVIASLVFGVVLIVVNAAGVVRLLSAWLPFVAGWARALDRNAVTGAYWPLLFGLAAPAIPALVWNARFDTSANRRKATLFVAALGLGLSPMLLAVIVSPFMPAVRTPAAREQLGVLLYLALVSVVPTTVYAVAVERVMDLQFIIRMTLRYALARKAVWALGLGPLAILALDIYQHSDVTIAEYSRLVPVGLLVLSGVSFGALTFREYMIRAVDRRYRREPIDSSQALARLELGFRSADTLRDLTHVLAEEVKRALPAKSVAVLLVSRDGTEFVPLEGSIARLPRQSALLEFLRTARVEVQLDFSTEQSMARLLPHADREWLAHAGVELLSPLLGSSETLLGVIAIGEAHHELRYTKRHLALVTAMSGQAAMQIENRWLRELPRDEGRTSPGVSGGVDWPNEPAVYCPVCSLTSSPDAQICACGTATVAAELPLVINGKFRVERWLGAGGTGVVYLASDLALGRQVAIKTLPVMAREKAMELYWEARAMAAVRHPNLALVYGAENWRGRPLLVAEYLEGGTLCEWLRRGPVSVAEAVDLGIVLADVLDRLHGSGLLHRDIKPSNIGYAADGTPKLLDFGLAQIVDRVQTGDEGQSIAPGEVEALLATAHPSATVTQRIFGTPLYMSPEGLNGAAPDQSFDLWSVGMVLYEVLARMHPLADMAAADVVRAIQRTPLADVRDYRPDCPAPVAAFLRDALSLVAARRPSSASDLRTQLRSLRADIEPHNH